MAVCGLTRECLPTPLNVSKESLSLRVLLEKQQQAI
jgi:hypothetical protein